MHLENVVIDAVDPHRLGRFWEAALGTEQLTDSPDGYETRLTIIDGAFLDLCFPKVPHERTEPLRLHLDLLGGARRDEVVARLLELGADFLDVGQGDVPWVVLGDPEGNPFCVLEPREAYRRTGPVAALPLDCADPAASAEFWSWLTGWQPYEGSAPFSLRHPSGHGPVLELCPEVRPKGEEKNRMHLDVRLDPVDEMDVVSAEVVRRGGSVYDHDWGDLPWRVHADPSGNEFCLLPAPTP